MRWCSRLAGRMPVEEITLDTSFALVRSIMDIRPADGRESTLYAQALDLTALWLDARRDRLRSAQGNTAKALWGLLIAGAFVLFAFHGMFVTHVWAVWAGLTARLLPHCGTRVLLDFLARQPIQRQAECRARAFPVAAQGVGSRRRIQDLALGESLSHDTRPIIVATSYADECHRSRTPYQPPDALSAKVEPVMSWIQRFWLRVSDGLKMDQLWKQFQADARASYRLYSADVDLEEDASKPKWKHYLRLAGQFFWAVLEKLSPARRILLLVALVLMFMPLETVLDTETRTVLIRFDAHFWGAALLLLVLVLEVSDRVVMKRDLQIAKEIQTWLLPANPPSVPGLEVAFHTRPANTVAGDYYDVFPRECGDSPPQSWLIAVADVAGKSIPAALLMATVQASLKTLSHTPLNVVRWSEK